MDIRKSLGRVARTGLEGLGLEVRRAARVAAVDSSVVTLSPPGTSKGTVLLSFIMEPFLRRPGEPISNAHSHDWESVQMAQTFLDMGFSVDVISYRNKGFVPRKDYAVFISARTNLEAVAARLSGTCLKIAHLETSHWLFNNQATYSRLLDVQRRRGAALTSGRFIEHNRAIEVADCATMLGNGFTMDTYAYAGKELFPIPVSAPSTYPWPHDKDFTACRNSFMWFGSAGFVHKGLDLVLEAFAGMPDCRLTVCGPVDRDVAFTRAFHTELYETPNITTVGWVDVGGDAFCTLAGSCTALIYPSCAEGQNGGAVTCMHAGLIPVVSRPSGLDVYDFGMVLEDCTVEEIRRCARGIAALPPEELRSRARRAWEYARRHHTRDNFARRFKETITAVLAKYSAHRLAAAPAAS